MRGGSAEVHGVAEVVLPAPGEIEAVHSLYLSLVQHSYGTEEDKAVLTRLAAGISEREGLDAVVLGGTDFAVQNFSLHDSVLRKTGLRVGLRCRKRKVDVNC